MKLKKVHPRSSSISGILSRAKSERNNNRKSKFTAMTVNDVKKRSSRKTPRKPLGSPGEALKRELQFPRKPGFLKASFCDIIDSPHITVE